MVGAINRPTVRVTPGHRASHAVRSKHEFEKGQNLLRHRRDLAGYGYSSRPSFSMNLCSISLEKVKSSRIASLPSRDGPKQTFFGIQGLGVVAVAAGTGTGPFRHAYGEGPHHACGAQATLLCSACAGPLSDSSIRGECAGTYPRHDALTPTSNQPFMNSRMNASIGIGWRGTASYGSCRVRVACRRGLGHQDRLADHHEHGEDGTRGTRGFPPNATDSSSM